jgi:hypothetical protein
MLKCNQNAVMGTLIYDKNGIEIWKTPSKEGKGGWIGIFNRNNVDKSIGLQNSDLGSDITTSSTLFDIWNNKTIKNLNFNIKSNGVSFIKYTK